MKTENNGMLIYMFMKDARVIVLFLSLAPNLNSYSYFSSFLNLLCAF